jgi:S1-C subfamily serine protease
MAHALPERTCLGCPTVWAVLGMVVVLLAALAAGRWASRLASRRHTVSAHPPLRSAPAAVVLDSATSRLPNQSSTDPIPSQNAVPADTESMLDTLLEQLERQASFTAKQVRESVVTLEYSATDAPSGSRRLATGVVVNQQGEILSVRVDQPFQGQTLAHDDRLATIVARDFAGRHHTVRWVAADPTTGLTLLQVAPGVVRAISRIANGPHLGSPVLVLGSPFGMGHTVRRGYVAGLDRVLELGPYQVEGLIQIQVPVYPGDSGALVVDLRGGWLGLIRSGLAVPYPGALAYAASTNHGPDSDMRSAGGLAFTLPARDGARGDAQQQNRNNDFAFAIPAHEALWVAGQLRAHRRVDRAYLGVRLGASAASGPAAIPDNDRQPTPQVSSKEASPLRPLPAIANSAQSGAHVGSREGASLHEVLAGTPAAEAGLQPGDRVVTLNGHSIRSARDFTEQLDHILARTAIQLEVVRRDGPLVRRITISLRTGSRPEAVQFPIVGTPTPPEASVRPAGPASATTSLVFTTASTSPHSASATPAAPMHSTSSGVTPTKSVIKPLLTKHAKSIAPAPQPVNLQPALPKSVLERLDFLERRLGTLEASRAQNPGTARLPNQ